jgi:hypothetical protein
VEVIVCVPIAEEAVKDGCCRMDLVLIAEVHGNRGPSRSGHPAVVVRAAVVLAHDAAIGPHDVA